MEKRCIIISGGEYGPIPTREAGDFVIACDKGYEYANRAGIIPDLLISDFDSCGCPIADNVPVLRYKSEKDDTDTMLAARYARENGFSHLEICCALGNRLDHTYANIQTAVFAAENGMSVRLAGQSDVLYVLCGGTMVLPRMDGYALSLFAYSDICRGVSVSGTKYVLQGAALSSSFPLGVSNAWTADAATISLDEGILLLIASKMLGD